MHESGPFPEQPRKSSSSIQFARRNARTDSSGARLATNARIATDGDTQLHEISPPVDKLDDV